jgi:hypothetical protein
MARGMLMTLLLAAPFMAGAADDLKVAQLEQDVRELQRQVQLLSRQIETQRPLAASPGASSSGRLAAPTSITAIPAWVDAARWQRLASGLSELEVISTLGPPTSMRVEGGERVLLYALEIGSSGFLRGSVTLRDRAVVAIQRPALQ